MNFYSNIKLIYSDLKVIQKSSSTNLVTVLYEKLGRSLVEHSPAENALLPRLSVTHLSRTQSLIVSFGRSFVIHSLAVIIWKEKQKTKIGSSLAVKTILLTYNIINIQLNRIKETITWFFYFFLKIKFQVGGLQLWLF